MGYRVSGMASGSSHVPHSPHPTPDTLRILIAVADAAAGRRVRDAITDSGHRVMGETSDADAAWRLAQRLRPDLVLLDVGLPDAFEAAEAIRTALDLPLLCLGAEPSDFPPAREAGADGFLVAPFTTAALQIALQLALDRHTERVRLRLERDALRDKLEARKLIERAKAILMDRHGISEPEAFRRLQSHSMATATSMRAIAEAVILGTRALEDC
jgi:AmiR/NasT family two-component response regulator